MKLAALVRISIGILALTASMQASANAILLMTDGLLTGAKNVSVEGKLYDVSFSRFCTLAEEGCTKFAFTSRDSARAAAIALLEQVFVNGPLGEFDSKPQLTSHCNDFDSCRTYIPYFYRGAGNFTSVTAINGRYPDNYSDGVGLEIVSAYGPRNEGQVFNFATFKVSPVPEPTSIAMMALGLAVLAFSRRQKP